MSKLKVLFQQAITITSGILLVVALEGILVHFLGEADDFALRWYHPISMIIAGLVCAVPTLALSGYEELEKRRVIARIFIHCILLYVLVALMGYVFRWYSTLWGFAYVSVAYFLVYIFVWVSSRWVYKQDDIKINEALKDIQDSE